MNGRLINLHATGIIVDEPLTAAPKLADLQNIVGGIIQIIPCFDGYIDINDQYRRCVAFCNDEGKIMGLPVNSNATLLWRAQCPNDDYLCGNVAVVIGDDELLGEL